VKKQRKHYTAEEKVAILRRRLVENLAVWDPCEEMGLQPTVFYRWQKSSLKTAQPPSSRKVAEAIRLRRNESNTLLRDRYCTSGAIFCTLGIPNAKVFGTHARPSQAQGGEEPFGRAS
jgi:transposase